LSKNRYSSENKVLAWYTSFVLVAKVKLSALYEELWNHQNPKSIVLLVVKNIIGNHFSNGMVGKADIGMSGLLKPNYK